MPPQSPFSLTWRNILRKLPVFFIAAAACWLLYSIDSLKKRHSDGRSGKIIVNNAYLDKLALALDDKTEVGRLAAKNFAEDRPLKTLSEKVGELEEVEIRVNSDPRGNANPGGDGEPVKASPRRVIKDTVMFHSFSTPEEMIEAVRAKLDARRDEDIKSYAVISDALVKAMAGRLREPAPPVQQKGSGGTATAGVSVAAEATTALPDARVKFEQMAKEVTALNAEARKAVDLHWKIADAKFGLVAGLDRERLKQSFISDGAGRKGLFYSAFEPILDEKRGAYVIFQMLWLGLAGVLLFCMIYVVTRALRVLLVSDGDGVILDQAKSLLTAARETPIRELPRASLLTVAALGTATAVAAGGIAAAGPTARVLAAPPAAEDETNPAARKPPPPDPNDKPAQGGRQADLSALVTTLDEVGVKMTGIMQTLSEREAGGVSQTNTHLTHTNSHLQNIGQILTSRLTNNWGNGSTGTEVMIPGLDAYTMEVAGYSKQVTEFAGEVKGYSAKLNEVATKLQECCKSGSGQTPTSQPPAVTPADVDALRTRVEQMQEALARIEGQLTRPPAPVPQPYREGTLSRLNPFDGGGQYRIRQSSLDALKAYFGKAGESGAGKDILEALGKLLDKEPLGDGGFINAIIDKMTVGGGSEERRRLLKPWRRVILRETRIS